MVWYKVALMGVEQQRIMVAVQGDCDDDAAKRAQTAVDETTSVLVIERICDGNTLDMRDHHEVDLVVPYDASYAARELARMRDMLREMAKVQRDTVLSQLGSVVVVEPIALADVCECIASSTATTDEQKRTARERADRLNEVLHQGSGYRLCVASPTLDPRPTP